MTNRKTLSLMIAAICTGTILFATATERPQTTTQNPQKVAIEATENEVVEVAVEAPDSTQVEAPQVEATEIEVKVAQTDSVAAEEPTKEATAKSYIKPGYKEQGKATHYADSWNGRKTASGEKLNIRDYQCAHRTLPFGTLIKVTNQRNGKSAVVRVIDRGPFVKGNVIDLTRAAAEKIGMWGHGVAKVTLEIVQPGTPVKNGEVVGQ